jgi:hypothetical protein
MGYITFFKNLESLLSLKSPHEEKESDILGLSPIIIFKGLH